MPGQKFNQGSDNARRLFSEAFNLEYHYLEETRRARNQFLTPGFSVTQRHSSDEDFFMEQKKHQDEPVIDEATFVTNLVYQQLLKPDEPQALTYLATLDEKCGEEVPVTAALSMQDKVVIAEKHCEKVSDKLKAVFYSTKIAPDGTVPEYTLQPPSPVLDIPALLVHRSRSSSPAPQSTGQPIVRSAYVPKRRTTVEKELLDPKHIQSYRHSTSSDYFLE